MTFLEEEAARFTGHEDFGRFCRFSRLGDGWPAPLSAAAFHGVAGEFVRLIEPHSEADPAALLISLLVAAGCALGPGPHAFAEADRHPGRLFAVIVGDTAKGRKGTSWGRPRDLVTLAVDGFGDRIVGGLSSGEGLVWQVRDPIIRARRPRNAVERDEADTDGNYVDVEDQGVPDKRLLVVEGEFAQPLRAARREGNTLSAVLRNLWDRGDVQTMTKNQAATVHGAHVSVLGHITAEELRRELSATDASNGLANRFLWMCARRSKLLPDGGALDARDLLPLAEELAATSEWARQPRVLSRDEDARELWHGVYGVLSDGRAGVLGSVTSRAEAQVLRMSVLYAALDRSAIIRRSHLEAALSVWQYSLSSAAWIFGEKTGDSVADRIAAALENRAGGMTRTDIRDLLDRNVGSDRIEHALSMLESGGRIVREKVSTGGRPSEIIRLTETT